MVMSEMSPTPDLDNTWVLDIWMMQKGLKWETILRATSSIYKKGGAYLKVLVLQNALETKCSLY